MVDEIRYPIGIFESKNELTVEERNEYINKIPEITQKLRITIKSLTNDQLQVPYREHGWTIQQVIHHMADNDMNAFLRFKRAITEKEPIVTSYGENLWSELGDYKNVSIEVSIQLLEAVHIRFVSVLRDLAPEEFNRKFRTQALGIITLEIALQRFIWHNNHHIAQISSLIERMKWTRKELL